MAITITSLTNSTGATNTFEFIGNDRLSSEWINTTMSVGGLDQRVIVKQTTLGKTLTGIPIKRALVQFQLTNPVAMTVGGNSKTVPETLTVNMTLTGPASSASLTAAQRRDLVALLKAFLNNSVADSLWRGDVGT